MGILFELRNNACELHSKENLSELYLFGGYNSFDHGCEPWGTNDESKALFIGDRAGHIELGFSDGTLKQIPLVFGYTMWFNSNWVDGGAPFKTEECDENAAHLLKSTLHLCGGYEGNKIGILKISDCGGLNSIKIINNPRKIGEPIFTGGFYCNSDEKLNQTINGETLKDDTNFFKSYIINLSDPMPDIIGRNLKILGDMLVTYEDEQKNAVAFDIPKGYAGAELKFSGDSIADAATGVFMINAAELANKIDSEGFFHTTTYNAPSWRYDGFGTYVPNCNSYYDCLYSRDGGRGILSLIMVGELSKAQAAIDFFNEKMMFYPRSFPELTFAGKKVPGHFSVIPNKPLIYSETLVNVGWPTSYTKEKFGDEHKNLGNIEIDGHGLLMMSNALMWRATGCNSEWVKDRWEYLNEAAEFLGWCLENPELSFCKDDVLYGESEATMVGNVMKLYGYSLYGNIPCLAGLRMYAEMAEAFGKPDEVKRWNGWALRIEKAIEREFCEPEQNDKWDPDRFGFFHDPVITMLCDICGFDISKIKTNWLERSQNTYEDDKNRYCKDSFYAPRGLGYDHNMLTQSALLLDKTCDADKLVNNLVRLCYAPKLQSPYIAPEAATVDLNKKLIRRQGDLGNLVQQAETVKTLLICAGLSGYEKLEVVPRLPMGWEVQFKDLPVWLHNGQSFNAQGSISSCAGGQQKIKLQLNKNAAVRFRVGPFDTKTSSVSAVINGNKLNAETFISGDAKWAWIEAEDCDFDLIVEN